MGLENFRRYLLNLKAHSDGSIWSKEQDPEDKDKILTYKAGTRIQMLAGKTIEDYKNEANKQIKEIAEGLQKGNKQGVKDEERIKVFQEIFGKPKEAEEVKSKKSK